MRRRLPLASACFLVLLLTSTSRSFVPGSFAAGGGRNGGVKASMYPSVERLFHFQFLKSIWWVINFSHD